jgi:tetratricopeptide (TPR) repeat protein
VAYLLLRGEGLSRAGRPSEAAAFYETSIKRYGRHDPVLRALAATYEALGELERARDLYTELMNQCQGCRTRPDPLIKRRLADVRFALGERGSAVLESYLSLAQEDPANGALYFDRISAVYGAMGNDAEARRFAAFARRAESWEKAG